MAPADLSRRRTRLRRAAAALAVVVPACCVWFVSVISAHDPDAYRFPAHPPGPARAPLALVAFGDSLAYGMCATRGHSFLALVARDLERARPGSTFAVVARPGATTASLVRRLGTEAPSHADAVVVVVGANDVERATAPTAFLDAFRGLLAYVHATYPHAAVAVLGVPDIAARAALVPPFLKPLVAAAARGYDGMEWRAARDHGATYYDFFALSDTPQAGLARNVCPDYVHPTNAGHAAIAAAIEPELRAAFQF